MRRAQKHLWSTLRNFVLLLAAAAVTSACGAPPDDGPAGETILAAHGRADSGPPLKGTVYVVHGINGQDLGLDEALPVDISVNDACALTNFPFREIAGPLMLDEGTYDIVVSLADDEPCKGAVAINAPGIFLPAGANVSIVAHLAEGGAPTATVFLNDLSRHPGRTTLIPRHAASFGLVDVVFDGEVVFGDVPNGAQGVAVVRPGKHWVGIAVADTDTFAFESRLVLRPFTAYIAYAVGTPANGTFEVLLQTLPIARSRW